jgi:hypothetical protein
MATMGNVDDLFDRIVLTKLCIEIKAKNYNT